MAKGFSLVEILVVITILTILVTIGIVQYNGINAKARDSARRSDIYQVSTALEVNKKISNYIPLQVNQFSSFQWSDPKGNSYCFGIGNPPTPAVSEEWGNTCPSGFVSVTPGVPGTDFIAWKICTFLEKPDNPSAHVFCKTNGQ